MPPLTLRQLNRATLARQGLIEPLNLPVPAAIEQLGALQSQHPDWPSVALWARLANFELHALEEAYARRAVVRGGLLRMTQHVVTAADFWPMWALTQPFRLDQWRLMCHTDPLDPQLRRRLRPAYRAAIAALEERPLRRDEFTAILRHLAPPDLRDLPMRGLSRHFMAVQPLVQVPTPGETYGRGRYTTAESWLGPRPAPIDLARARVALLRRHLGAFGPATLDDALAWIGRGRGGIGPWRDALAQLRPALVELEGPEGEPLLDLAEAPRPGDGPAPPRFLARWDSLLLAYAVSHRTRILPAAHHRRVNLKNADLLPTFLVDGMVAGTWEPVRQDGRARLELRPFGQLPAAVRRQLVGDGERLIRFMRPDAAAHEVAIGP